MASGSFTAPIFPTTGNAPPLQVSEFITNPASSNVAVCLSGGGSRALSAGMGALNGLRTVSFNSSSLLSQVRALSTVSGGSWCGVPFTYLPSSFSDADYLGGPYLTPGQLTVNGLGTFPNGCIGSQINTDFTLEDLFFQAFLLYLEDVPPNMLWQTLMGLQLLTPYGLYPIGDDIDTPDSFFSYDQTSLAGIVAANPNLQSEACSLVSTQPRPYLVCNTAMFVTSGGQSLLAPVQATSFMTGIISAAGGTDANGFPAGGGGVQSFAFNSAPTAFDQTNEVVTVQQQRQWSLMDIVGSSSAAFAATLEQWASYFQSNPEHFAIALSERGPVARNFLVRSGVPVDKSRARVAEALMAHAQGRTDDLQSLLDGLSDLIPIYQYWPVLNPPVNQTINTTEFADGGSLENSGVAAMLAYGDIQSIIAFVNTVAPMSKDGHHHIVLDDAIPPLFGYQPYVAGIGYKLYAGDSNPSGPLYQNNQVFPSSAFADVQANLWAASGSGTFQNPPIYAQSLTTVQNTWFNVPAGRQVTVLWVYLERAAAWYNQLPSHVQKILGPFDSMLNNFPHYSTFDTELSPTEVNLLANYTAWAIVNAQNTFTALF